MKRQSSGSEQIDQLLYLIDAGNLSASERRRQYRAVIELVARNLAVSKAVVPVENEKDTT